MPCPEEDDRKSRKGPLRSFIGHQWREAMGTKVSGLPARRVVMVLAVTVLALAAAPDVAAQPSPYSKGSYAYGGYPDIDELFQQQARERDSAKREALLHRIQQLTIDRVMFAPIWNTRVVIGVGPRVADHTINLVPMSIWPSYEDMRLRV